MKVSCFELKETGALEPADPEETAARWLAGDGAFWIDLNRYRTRDLQTWLDALDLKPFAKELCLDIGKTTQMIALPDFGFLEVTIFADKDFSRLTNVGLLCLENLLITFHPEPVHAIEESRRLVDLVEINDLSTSYLFILLLLIEARKADAAARAIQKDVTAIDKRMEHDPGSVGLDEILAARDAVSMLVAVSEEQQQCFEVLAVEETEALDFSGVRGSVTMLLSMTSSVNRRADRLEKRVTDLRQRFEMHQQDTTNRNLAVLTIISAIFLPLSLLAGIWGMKFESMPELHFSMGYPLALGLMVLIAVVLTWFFYRRGWFG